MLVSAAMNGLEFRADHRLSDTIALQFFVLRHHLLRRGLILAVFMMGGLAVATLMNGAPPSDSLEDLGHNAGRYLMIFLVGLAVIHVIALIMAVLSWHRLARPRQIRAVITADGITLRKDGFSYGARWSDANLLTENRDAFLMKFNQLYMRLPKRGFVPGEDAQFRGLVRTAVPAAANRLRAN
jgi:hypothetical protein